MYNSWIAAASAQSWWQCHGLCGIVYMRSRVGGDCDLLRDETECNMKLEKV